MKYAHLPLAAKLLLAPAGVFLCLVGLAAYVMAVFSGQRAEVHTLDSDVVESVYSTMSLARRASDMHSGLYRVASTAANEADAGKLTKVIAATSKELTDLGNEIAKFAATDETQEKKDALAAFLLYQKQAALVLEMSAMDAGYGVMMLGKADDLYKGVRDGLDRQIVEAQGRRQVATSNLFSAMDRSQLVFSAVVLAAAVLVGFSAYVVHRRVSLPIRRVTSALGVIASGNLAVNIADTDRTDDIGLIARAVEFLRQGAVDAKQQAEIVHTEQELRLRKAEALARTAGEFDARVAAMIQALSQASVQLEQAAGEMTTTSEGAGRKAELVSAESAETAMNVQGAASAAEELTASIAEIARQVDNSARITRDAVGETEQTEAKVACLDDTVRKIGDVVHIIANIAGQTNLLALNATIEAARAGDAGKGFAVVATEVKHLATQTAEATTQISNQIANVQSQTKLVVDAIRGIVAVIQEVGTISDSIAASVQEQSAATGEIAASVERAAAGTAKMTENVTALDAAAAQTGTVALTVQNASHDLARQSEDLKSTIAQFLTAVRTA